MLCFQILDIISSVWYWWNQWIISQSQLFPKCRRSELHVLLTKQLEPTATQCNGSNFGLKKKRSWGTDYVKNMFQGVIIVFRWSVEDQFVLLHWVAVGRDIVWISKTCKFEPLYFRNSSNQGYIQNKALVSTPTKNISPKSRCGTSRGSLVSTNCKPRIKIPMYYHNEVSVPFVCGQIELLHIHG